MKHTDWKKTLTTQKYRNPFLAVQGALDEAVDDFYHLIDKPRFSSKEFENLLIEPSIDIVDDKTCFKVEAEMPGLSEEDIKVSINDGILTIKGEKETSTKDEGKNYLRREINYGSYERRISLPDSADLDRAKASFKKGMLWIEIPKTKETKQQARELKIEKK